MSPSWTDFFLRPPEGEACLGVVLGRRSLWTAQTRKVGKGIKIEGMVTRVSLPVELFQGNPSPEALSGLTESLVSSLGKWNKSYLTLQVALPDPALKIEVFELEKVPVGKKSQDEFLKWRFKAGPKEAGVPLTFATQLLGEEKSKSLLLGIAMEEPWRAALLEAFRRAGVFVSVMDLAACHRINLFLGELQKKAAGSALLTFDSEYWSLTILDKESRLRFIRSKWWGREVGKVKDLPLQETLAEVERTIRSYVYVAKDRNVETLYVTAPHEWLGPLVAAINKEVEGGCVGLSPDGVLPSFQAEDAASPSVLATAVKR